MFFNPSLGWLCGFSAGITALVLQYFIKRDEECKKQKSGHLQNLKGREGCEGIIKYMKFTIMLNVLAAVVILVSIAIGFESMVILILPVALHYIASNIVISNIFEKHKKYPEENILTTSDDVGKFMIFSILSITAVFISVILVVSLYN